MTYTDNSATLYNALRLIDNLQAQVDTLRRERDEARASTPEKPTPEEWWNMALSRNLGPHDPSALYAHEQGMLDGIAWLRNLTTPTPGAQA